jgi:hypothetical protein
MAKKVYDFEDAEVDYEPTLRREAKKRGWIKGATETKRQTVKDALAGLPTDLTKTLTNDEVRQKQAEEAALDVNDMRSGLELFRTILRRCVEMAGTVEAAKDVKIVAEAGKTAIDGIRRIRGLDEGNGSQSLGEFLANLE